MSSLLQVIVWGDYGRMDRKVFMGVVQILLDELDLSNLVIGWYKLFSTSSMCDPPLPSPSSPIGGSPKKSPGPSPRSSMNQGVASPMRGASPLPTIIPPPGHMHNMDEEGDYVWVRQLLKQNATDSAWTLPVWNSGNSTLKRWCDGKLAWTRRAYCLTKK